MFSNYQTPSLRSQLTIKEEKDCILVYPTSEGTGLIDFTLEMTFDGNELLVNHTIVINSILQVNDSLERIMVMKVRRSQDILLISDIRTSKRLSKLFQGRLLSTQSLVAVAPRADWFSPENNRLAALLGDLNNSSDTPLDKLISDEYPCKINSQERQKVRAYIRARGVQWRALTALANALPFFLVRIRNRGVNDAILRKKFHW